jgi:Cys-tRNA(Pro)/Cys-tRNA(Cys) deacylase
LSIARRTSGSYDFPIMTIHPKVEERLKQHDETFKVREHTAFGVPIKSPADFARALGYPIERIAKSVLLRGQSSQEFVLAVCSVSKKFDLAIIAKLFHTVRLELATAGELLEKTDYPPTGVSPIGVDPIPVVVDQGLLAYETILIGGGVVGVEIEIAPRGVIACSKAIVGTIAR